MKPRKTRRRARRARLGLGLIAASALGAATVVAPGDTARANYPGTNGKIICSGALATEIPTPIPAGQSRLELFTMDPDGSNQTRLQHNTNSDYSPRYSADGTKVAFVRDDGEIWTMNADGTNEVEIVPATGAAPFVGDWSPDGTQIVFSARIPAADGNPTNFEVLKVDADGSNLVNLTNNPTTGANSDTQPSWSPDGTQIAFQSNRDGNPDIHLMNPDGTYVANLTEASAAEESAPRWAPDGTKLAFQSNRAVFPRPGVAPNYEIYRMNADGSDITRLTFSDYSGGGTTSPFDVTGYDVFPAWSPEGDRIVFHSGRAPEYRDSGAAGVVGQWEVYTIDSVTGEAPGTGGATRLTDRPGNDERCDWQPIPRQVLSVSLAGAGSGTVVSAPSGIDCGTDCSEAFARDSQVTLAAAAAQGSTFAGFSGGGCSGTDATCTVTMSEARSVTATFALVPAATPAPTATPTPTPETTLTRQVAGLSVRVTPKRDRRRPFRFRVRGRVTHPSSVQVADACQGRVTIRWKAGKKTISSRRTQLIGLSCRYSQRVKFRAPRRFGRRSVLRVQVKFEGNKFLLPRRAKTVRARVR